MNRRLLGMLAARLPEAHLERVPDPRRAHGRKWPLRSLLSAVLVAMCAACRSLAAMESLTAEVSPAVRRKLGLWRRVPDTTVRDVLVRLDPSNLRRRIHSVVHAALRRKAIKADVLPFGVASMDGKVTAIEAWDDDLAQRQVHGGSGTGAHGLVRTVTTVLISSRAKPVLDASPIPPETNEDGHFQTALDELLAAHGRQDLFRMVMCDSGACSRANAQAVRDRHLHYTFRLDAKQPTLLAEASRLLGHRPLEEADAISEDMTGRGLVRRAVFLTEEAAGYHDWSHLRTVVRVRSETLGKGGEILACEDRYYLSSLAQDRLSTMAWLRLVRLRWGVENQGHHTLDVALAEDKRPWITSDPAGMVAVLLLRRLAHNLLALFRAVTQRSDERRSTPWKDLMRAVYNALVGATDEQLEGLRVRTPVTEEIA